MILHHFVLDTSSLLALAAHRQVSAMIHRAYLETDSRIWAPVLCILEADRERSGTAEHVGQLEVIHTVDLDYPAMLATAQLHRDGVPFGVGAAIHALRHLPHWGADNAVLATVDPKAYHGRNVPIFDLNR